MEVKDYQTRIKSVKAVQVTVDNYKEVQDWVGSPATYGESGRYSSIPAVVLPYGTIATPGSYVVYSEWVNKNWFRLSEKDFFNRFEEAR